jgi:hypothetical protein
LEEPITHDEALAEFMVDLLGRRPRCRLALSGKAHEQLGIQGVSLATTGQRASEQRDLARVEDAHDVVGLMQSDGKSDPVVPSRFHHNQGCVGRHASGAELLEEGGETILTLLEGNSLGSGRWVKGLGGRKGLGGDIDADIQVILRCHR